MFKKYFIGRLWAKQGNDRMELTPELEEKYRKDVLNAYRRLMRPMRHCTKSELAIMRKAFEYARDAHEGTRRKSGEPYILHPMEVARIIVVEMGLDDPTSVIAALLHDVVEDTDIGIEEIKREFGNTAANIIDGLTKISGSELEEVFDETNSAQAENFRKILLTISDDIRVVLIKLADRLHNMRTLGSMRPEKMLKITSETLYLYAPLAHRLGLYNIKSELEDHSLRFSQPALYKEISEKLSASKEDAQKYIDRFIKNARRHLKRSSLNFTIKSRFKSIYSIYTKMQRKNLPFEEIHDIYAIRIILETREGREREDAWHIYSAISSLYRPNPKRLRDWITVPKENGYEALHTTVMGPDGQWVEVQIRTQRMDDVAEKGVAAHWKYKENGELYDEALTEWIAQVRHILENPSLNALEAVREFKENLQPNDVFVFTPKGKLVRLPMSSTVLDFAYKIHTRIGDTAIGAKLNNEVVTLEHPLRPGDQVEVLTSKKQEPQHDWLRFVKTARAKNYIKTALRKREKEIIDKGRKIFNWRARQYGVNEDHSIMKELLAYFMAPTPDDFYLALGSHKINTRRIVDFIQMKKEGKEVDHYHMNEWERRRQDAKERLEEFGVTPDMLVLGKDQDIDNYTLANCCEPVPGDDILGFMKGGSQVIIHRTSCPQAISLMSNFGSRIINAKWAKNSQDVSFLAGIKVVGLDKQGMLNDLIRIISLYMKLNIRKVTIESQGGMFEGLFHLYVHNTEELQAVIDRIDELPHVYTVSRSDSEYKPFEQAVKE